MLFNADRMAWPPAVRKHTHLFGGRRLATEKIDFRPPPPRTSLHQDEVVLGTAFIRRYRDFLMFRQDTDYLALTRIGSRFAQISFPRFARGGTAPLLAGANHVGSRPMGTKYYAEHLGVRAIQIGRCPCFAQLSALWTAIIDISLGRFEDQCEQCKIHHVAHRCDV